MACAPPAGQPAGRSLGRSGRLTQGADTSTAGEWISYASSRGESVTNSPLDDPATPSGCEVTVEHFRPAVVLRVRGDIDGSASAVLLPAYDEAVRHAGQAERHIVLDLSAVEHIASSGVAGIVSVVARARTQGRTVVACGLSERCRQVFAATRLSDYVTLRRHRAAALAGLRLAGPRTARPR
jgi:anti-sigma B factor antagonist